VGALEHAFPLGYQEPFPYETLLAFHLGQLGGRERAQVQRQLATDPRWRAHLDSVRYLKLEQVAARQDTADLQRYRLEDAMLFCAAVARTHGAVVQKAMAEKAGKVEGHTWGEWDAHLDRCVYCRRMHRDVQARVAAQAHKLAGELLLRDWLLVSVYRDALEAVTRQLRRAQGLPVDENDASVGTEGATTTTEAHVAGETKVLTGSEAGKGRQP
jgi:hypothetical protein